MAMYELDGVMPIAPESTWIADSAQVIGDVELGEEASVWFGSVLRGDTEKIVIGAGSNVQDASILHTVRGLPLIIGENVTIGHQVSLHSCTIGDGALIGIGAVILNGAKIGKDCVVGAGSVITEGKEFPDGVLIVGSPARVVKKLTQEQIEDLHQRAQLYVNNSKRFKRGLRKAC